MKNFFKDHLLEILLALFVFAVIVTGAIAIATIQPESVDSSLANPASPIHQALFK
jgi:Tfp pilus assembly protein PilV